MEPYDSTKVIKIGDSLYVRIPALTCQRMSIEKGTPMYIYRDENLIMYGKVTE